MGPIVPAWLLPTHTVTSAPTTKAMRKWLHALGKWKRLQCIEKNKVKEAAK